MNRDDLAAARQTIAAALAEVYALCQGEHRTGGHRFRMSIPVEKTDSDIVLLKGLQAGEAALDELAALPPTGSPETLREALIQIAAQMVRLEGGCEQSHRKGQWHMHEEPYHAIGRQLARLTHRGERHG